MAQNQRESVRAALFFNVKILQMFYDASQRAIEQEDITDVLVAVKTIHFIMQTVVFAKFAELAPEQVPQETSAFDEYDRENGYEDELEDANPWQIIIDNIEAVIKMAINVLHDSYSGCMNAELVPLLDHIAYEIRTINNK